MSIRDNFFDAKAIGSLWDVAVSLKRGNPLPIDADSVFESEAKLVEYIGDKITTVAYPGQVVAVVNADSTQIFYIDQELNYHPVGAKLDADGKSIKVDNNVLKLVGFDEAADGLLAQVKVDAEGNRTLNWVSIETIAEGDGNTTYTFTGLDKESNVYFEVKASDADAATKIYLDAYTKKEIDDKFAALSDNDTTYTFANGTEGKFTVTPKDGEAIEVNTGAKDYVDGIIGKKAEGETAATGIHADIATAKAEAIEAASYDDTALAKRVSDIEADYLKEEDKYDDTALSNRVKAIEDAGYQNASDVSGAISTALNSYYDKDTIDSKVEALEKADSDLDTAVKAAQAAAENAQKDIDTFMGTIASDTAAIDTLTEVIALIESEDSELSSALLAEINGLKEKFNEEGKALEAVNADTLDGKNASDFADATAFATLSGDVATLTEAHNALDDAVEAVEGDVATLKAIDHDKIAKDAADAAITAHNADKSHLTANDVDGQIDAKLSTADYEGKIATAKGEAIADALAGVLVKSVDEQFTVDTDGKLFLEAIASSKVTGLDDALTNRYTKDEVDAIIGDKPTKTVDEETGKNVYSGASGLYVDIYTKDEVTDLISSFTGGESAADVLAELNKYKSSNDDRVKAIEDTIGKEAEGENAATGIFADIASLVSSVDAIDERINGVDERINGVDETINGINGTISGINESIAGINESITGIGESIESINTSLDSKIEGVKVNGVALEAVDHIVDIPAATASAFGVVKLGNEFKTNEETGALEVNTININKIEQTEGDVLILNGGLASNLNI